MAAALASLGVTSSSASPRIDGLLAVCQGHSVPSPSSTRPGCPLDPGWGRAGLQQGLRQECDSTTLGAWGFGTRATARSLGVVRARGRLRQPAGKNEQTSERAPLPCQRPDSQGRPGSLGGTRVCSPTVTGRSSLCPCSQRRRGSSGTPRLSWCCARSPPASPAPAQSLPLPCKCGSSPDAPHPSSLSLLP